MQANERTYMILLSPPSLKSRGLTVMQGARGIRSIGKTVLAAAAFGMLVGCTTEAGWTRAGGVA